MQYPNTFSGGHGQPDYGDFVRLDGLPGNEAIKNRDDAATVGVGQDADGDAVIIVMAPRQMFLLG